MTKNKKFIMRADHYSDGTIMPLSITIINAETNEKTSIYFRNSHVTNYISEDGQIIRKFRCFANESEYVFDYKDGKFEFIKSESKAII